MATSNLKEMAKDFWAQGKVTRVTFTKRDGSERVMRCALDGQYIPKDKIPSGKGSNKGPDVQSVFDLDVQEWRSFRWDSVKAVELVA